MAGPFKTPDIYVDEVSLFPPSVAEVETAVPAFIGYTEKAERFGGTLHRVPTRIKSLLEYQELFGSSAPVKVEALKLNENNLLVEQQVSAQFYMYDALQLFFKNGGGKCYIISIGLYADKETFVKKHFTDGLLELRKMDEPTLILFPDAVLMKSDDLYDVQKDALKQCQDLMDRFCVFDLLEERTDNANFSPVDGPEDFRNKIGINFLKYGSAYSPWLKTSLGLNIRYRDVKGKIERAGVKVPLEQLTDDDKVKETVKELDKAVTDANQVAADLEAKIPAGLPDWKAAFSQLQVDFKTTPDATTFGKLFASIYGIARLADTWMVGAKALLGDDIKAEIAGIISGPLKDSISKLIGYDKLLATTGTLTAPGGFPFHDDGTVPSHSTWGGIFTGTTVSPADATVFPAGATTDLQKMLSLEPKVAEAFAAANVSLARIVNSAKAKEAQLDQSLAGSHDIYKNMLKRLASSITKVPPSGAVVGAYAMVDGSRGVWKAPANVSLSGVVGVTWNIDFDDQSELNVDVVAGKSINAIRPFTGKGILIWGARTLAGNDNEWRYVPVRRFFNMVEESIKKSTYWAVFEPNDANTWIKVKGMIENYLILKWRDGALQGAKPADAFFVKIGLGVTMTALDILEGRMYVEIGMAVVRPAEFIILKFSHKMAVS
jgi:uncharacterized protein